MISFQYFVIKSDWTFKIVGDYLYFDNENTGGSGASGIVSEIKGAPVVRGYTDRTETYFQSHLQQLNVGTSVYDPILCIHNQDQ